MQNFKSNAGKSFPFENDSSSPLLIIFKDFLWELSIAVVAAILLSGFFDEKVLISLTRSSLVIRPVREMFS